MEKEILWLQKGASWAAILTLLFAVGTYWYDFIAKKIRKRRIIDKLNIELRTIYISVRDDILQYYKVKKDNYSKPFRRKVFNYPTLQWVINSGNLTDYFKSREEFGCICAISNLLSLIDNVDESALQRPNPKILDFFFLKRLFPLRDSLIELTQLNSYFDLSIMPKEYEGNSRTQNYIKDYDEMKKNEENVCEIIKEYLPNQPFRKLSEQYFGK